MTARSRLWLLLAALLSAAAAQAPAPAPASALPGAGALLQMDQAISALIAKVGPSVVEIDVTGFGAVAGGNGSDADLVVGPQRAVGAGFVIDPSGYIVTNAHVVEGGRQFEIVLPQMAAGGPLQSLSTRGLRRPARLVGVAGDIDLAVLKVDGLTLPALPLARYGELHQGELVLAFGSPGGLTNSVSLGVVSATARQSSPDSPLVYIQTDAAINPGNSGGPLVNPAGEVVGVNTFILSQSGGNEGLGFALPSNLVRVSFDQIKRFGHVHRAQIGIDLQSVTPTLAAGLSLSRQDGLIVSDVFPDGPAAQAGVQPGDLLRSVNGSAIGNVPEFMFYMMTLDDGAQLQLDIERGGQDLTVNVVAHVPPHEVDALAAAVDPTQNLVRPLGILGVEITPDLASAIEGLRTTTGVVVVARAAGFTGDVPLQANDVIIAVNNQPVATLAALRAALRALPQGAAVALRIQRGESLMYIAFNLGN